MNIDRVLVILGIVVVVVSVGAVIFIFAAAGVDNDNIEADTPNEETNITSETITPPATSIPVNAPPTVPPPLPPSFVSAATATAQAIGTATPDPNCVVRQDWNTYFVRTGDTLALIAAQFNTSVEELAAGNCLANINLLTVGQALRVP